MKKRARASLFRTEIPKELPRKSALRLFDPTPGSKIMNKVCFFYQPYNRCLGLAKHMEFEDHSNL